MFFSLMNTNAKYSFTTSPTSSGSRHQFPSLPSYRLHSYPLVYNRCIKCLGILLNSILQGQFMDPCSPPDFPNKFSPPSIALYMKQSHPIDLCVSLPPPPKLALLQVNTFTFSIMEAGKNLFSFLNLQMHTFPTGINLQHLL